MAQRQTISKRQSKSLESETQENLLHHFLVFVKVLLEKPAKDPSNNEGATVGYFVNIGVSARSAAKARQLIQKEINDGHIDWADSEWRSLTPLEEALDEQVYRVTSPQIWFESARIFFPAEQVLTS